MAIMDMPYMQFYVDDWSNNEKLRICELAAHGLMINLMCRMHKTNGTYGELILNQKFKQKPSTVECFALQLVHTIGFTYDAVLPALQELLRENVIKLEGEKLICGRMYRDGQKSITRALSGAKGGSAKKHAAKNESNNKANNQANTQAKSGASSVIVIGNGNGTVNGIEENGQSVFLPPTIESVEAFFNSCMVPESEAHNFYNHYNSLDWKSGNTLITRWKDKATIWVRKYKAASNNANPVTTNKRDIARKISSDAAQETINKLEGKR